MHYRPGKGDGSAQHEQSMLSTIALLCFAVALLQSFLVLQVYVPASKDFSLDLRYCIGALQYVSHIHYE